MDNETKEHTQKSAAEYLRERWGIKISSAQLSTITKFHQGPPCKKHGYIKVFTEEALDVFAKELLAHEDAAILIAA